MKTPTNRIRVVHIITRFDKGGSAENTFLTLRDLDLRRYEQFLLCGPPTAVEEEGQAVADNLAVLARRGVGVTIVPSLAREIAPLRDLRAFFHLHSLLCHLRPSICHTHTSKAGILGRWAAKMARVPIVIHTPHGHVFWGYFGPFKTRMFVLLERLTAKITDRIVTLTNQEKEDHLHFRIATPEKFAVIHSGIDAAVLGDAEKAGEGAAGLRTALRIPPGCPVVGTVGRLTDVKGHTFLIRAVARIHRQGRKISLIIVGDGELRQVLEEEARRLGIGDNIVFAGWRRNVPVWLALLDIFVFPSLNEGMGKAIVEAMAVGKPVIASATGGILDLVDHGVNGLLVPPGDEEALARAIMHLLDEPGLAQVMGEEGKKRFATHSSTEMINKIDALYLELLDRRRIDSLQTKVEN